MDADRFSEALEAVANVLEHLDGNHVESPERVVKLTGEIVELAESRGYGMLELYDAARAIVASVPPAIASQIAKGGK